VLENIHQAKVLQPMTAFGGIKLQYLCCCRNKGCIHNRLACFLFLELNATNELVTADAAADNTSNSLSADIFDVMSITDRQW